MLRSAESQSIAHLERDVLDFPFLSTDQKVIFHFLYSNISKPVSYEEIATQLGVSIDNANQVHLPISRFRKKLEQHMPEYQLISIREYGYVLIETGQQEIWWGVFTAYERKILNFICASRTLITYTDLYTEFIGDIFETINSYDMNCLQSTIKRLKQKLINNTDVRLVSASDQREARFLLLFKPGSPINREQMLRDLSDTY